jgi:hypothetical protein
MIDVSTMTDDRMMAAVGSARGYTTCVLRPGPQWGVGDWEKVIWEHGRRNLVMRERGLLVVTLRVPGPDVVGIGVYDRDLEETRALLADDPAVRAGILDFTLHPSDGFPGDALP